MDLYNRESPVHLSLRDISLKIGLSYSLQMILLKNLTLQKPDHNATAVFVLIGEGVINNQHFVVFVKRRSPILIPGGPTINMERIDSKQRQSA